MDKKTIELKLNQIIRAANALSVQGEGNAVQIVGICRAAREVWSLVNVPEKNEEVKENG